MDLLPLIVQTKVALGFFSWFRYAIEINQVFILECICIIIMYN